MDWEKPMTNIALESEEGCDSHPAHELRRSLELQLRERLKRGAEPCEREVLYATAARMPREHHRRSA
jgi:hypothetical protein